MTKATQMYPELLWKYDTVKLNLNSYFHDTEMEDNPGSKLYMWSMFGIETIFSGKTYNIDMIEQGGHRAYLMNKKNDWSDYKDDDYDFMYNEETGSDFKLIFLNQILEGTQLKLNDYENKFMYYENMDMYEDLYKDEYENEYQDKYTFVLYANNSGEDGNNKQHEPPQQNNRGWSTVKSPPSKDCTHCEDVLNDIKCDELITSDID
ncbi:hypothetical protein INT45_012545 [Circinella minor]|uniref:Uncharacterized protein n=1 Tax=Circinella minor TaxID=1195481 RepID=A0A8H7RIW1_9FUNG|nr:hypothetical protein INT45_012545 [Circinella minor]